MTERLVIVGPGRMGLALGAALRQQGALERLTFLGRALEPPPHPIFELEDVEYQVGQQPPPRETTVVLLAVPDHALAAVAADLASAGEAPAGCAALHLAGAISTDVLAPLHAVGYAVGSLHPLQAVADAWSGGERLLGSAFGLAGEPEALGAARRLVSALGGRPLVIPASRRPVYDAAATAASTYLVALASAAVRMLVEAGAAEADARAAVLGLMRGSLDNVEHLGPSAALTGLIARADTETLRLHLARLSPADRPLYCALGRETLRLARAAGLDEERAAHVESLLSAY